MSQIFDPIPHATRTSVLCCYVNATNQIQVARITNIDNWYFERVVFPGQRLVFEAVPEALLEIHSGMMASAILSDTIPCHRLAVKEDNEDNEGNEGMETTQDVAVSQSGEQKGKKAIPQEFSDTFPNPADSLGPVVAAV